MLVVVVCRASTRIDDAAGAEEPHAIAGDRSAGGELVGRHDVVDLGIVRYGVSSRHVIGEGGAERSAEAVAARLGEAFTTPPENRPYSAETAPLVTVVSWIASSMNSGTRLAAEVLVHDDAVDHEQVLERHRAGDGDGLGRGVLAVGARAGVGDAGREQRRGVERPVPGQRGDARPPCSWSTPPPAVAKFSCVPVTVTVSDAPATVKPTSSGTVCPAPTLALVLDAAETLQLERHLVGARRQQRQDEVAVLRADRRPAALERRGGGRHGHAR